MPKLTSRKTAALALACVLATSACDLGTFTGAEAISLIGTDKTVFDHIVSVGAGKDCSTVRREQGRTYCVEDETQIRQEIYCYNTLGSVTCYDRPDPQGSGQQRVDRNDHNLPN